MTIRVGIIGLNYGARVHIPAFKANPKYEVVAVCARTPGRAEAVARQNNIPAWYTDARQLMADKNVDLVSIAAPPAAHAGLAAAALAAGKHAAVEVAFVPAALDARVLVGIAKERKRVGAVAYVFRYTPNLRMVTDLLANNRIGQPKLMRFDFLASFLAQPDQTFRWMWDGANGGGILSGFVSHVFDLAWRWFGPVREVDATLATFADVAAPADDRPLADDTGFVTLHFESGMLATFCHSAAIAYPRTAMELHGSEGSLLIEGFGEEVSLLPMGAHTAEIMFPPEAYLEATRGHSGLQGGFTIFLDHLADAVRSGATPRELPTFADGLIVTRLTDAIKLASKERRRVSLSEMG